MGVEPEEADATSALALQSVDGVDVPVEDADSIDVGGDEEFDESLLDE